MEGLTIQMGTVVELKREEIQKMSELTHEMSSLVWHQRAGWFFRYMMCHREIHRLFKIVAERSHEQA